MIKLRTEYQSPRGAAPLDPEKKIVLLGSCFTTSIGERMRFCKWDACVNPAGVLYNPYSIAEILDLVLDGGRDARIERSVVERDGRWMSWLMDSTAAGFSRQECVLKVKASIAGLRDALCESPVMIVTFGTSWVYELAETQEIVANCHKFPERTFVRRRMSVDEIVERWKSTAAALRSEFGDIRLIFTVSPVRHLRDGFEGNACSKATLLLACERILSEIENVGYFPSYEILTDDLRDYRFYADDLLHPSSVAVEYIWEKFCETYLTEKSMALLKEGERQSRRERHRPILSPRDL